MLPRISFHSQRASKGAFLTWIAVLATASFSSSAPRAFAQFSSGSDGSDGALDYTGQTGTCGSVPSCIYFDPVALKLKGTKDSFCVYQFTYITIPAGLTVRLSAKKLNCPTYWLSQKDVTITGTLDLSGFNGPGPTQDADVRVPPEAGSGGYAGGVGGNLVTGQSPTPGDGPGGGAAGGAGANGGSATFNDDQYLIPLIGGSGGGGTSYPSGYFGPGGGSGGGAILIASSTQIVVNGNVYANGGIAGGCGYYGCGPSGGGGSGGAVRLVSNAITGAGDLSALGSTGAASGRVRLEAYTISPNLSFLNNTPVSESTPLNKFKSFIPNAPQPSVQVTSIAGMAITENPFSFPDITINTDQPVPVVISGNQVPVGTIPTLVILGETADKDLRCTAGLQQNGLPAGQTSCTINIMFNYGGSRGLVKTTWQNSGSK